MRAMRVQSVFVANHAEITPKGLLSVTGGGWEFFKVRSLPANMRGVFAGFIDVEPSEVASPVQLRFTVGPDGLEPRALGSRVIRGKVRQPAFAFPFVVVIDSLDPIACRLLGPEGDELAVVELEIRMREEA